MNSNILVTGSNGQLGECFKSIVKDYPQHTFFFTDKSNLDITNQDHPENFFQQNKIDWCINCAAYTAVDKAESDIENAKKINTIASENLAIITKKHNTKLIHVSTDFVFDGNHHKAYTEEDKTNPISVYGQTKLDGENAIVNTNSKHFIIRTSWLYSEFGNNFLKTMLRLAESRDEISVVSDQIGTPTYAKDLADFIIEIINQDSNAFGIYHYSNEGTASWYDFAKAIFEIKGVSIKVNPIETVDYPTPAKRPHFSVLNKTKIKKVFDKPISHWKDSLKNAVSHL